VGSDIQPAGVVAAVGDTSVEVVLPEGGSGRQLFCSGGSVVLRVDPVGGPPDVDFTDEGDARPTAWPSPDRRRALVRVYLDVSGGPRQRSGHVEPASACSARSGQRLEPGCVRVHHVGSRAQPFPKAPSGTAWPSQRHACPELLADGDRPSRAQLTHPKAAEGGDHLTVKTVGLGPQRTGRAVLT
jgi:hypothetical protein